MYRAFLLAVVSFVALFGVGCGNGSETGATREKSSVMSLISDAPDATKLGVFASTNDGLKELVVYGEQTGTASYRVPQLATAPTARNIKALYLNMPGTEIMSSKAFVVPTSELRQSFEESSAYTVPVSFETVRGNLYKVVVPDLGRRDGSVLLFKVSMPMGTADRLYAINLGG
ncbi:MAG: hypothetical protein QOK37_372 [Thermoanaerobaculia bacterium]|jgi:hypothetical protein|nr:hypothetical protein [Thermoanaerobaculia bacterium]